MSKKVKVNTSKKQKNPSEPIKKLLEIVSHEHSCENVSANILKYPEVLQELKESDMKFSDEFLDSCLSIFRCYHCKQLPQHFLACKHWICGTCLDSCLANIEAYLIEPLIFYCPFCEFEHTSQDMQKVAPEKWNELVMKVKHEKVQRGKEKVCKKCKSQKNSSSFPLTSACGHHETCFECLAEGFLNGKFFCEECKTVEKFKVDIASVKGCCSVCSQSVYYVGDYLTSICDSHLHCYECLKKARELGRCKTCGQKLSPKSIEKMDQKLWKHCGMCRTQFESPLITKKTCCDSDICLFCQCRDREMCFKCINCEQNLLPSTLELILETQSVIDNFTP